MDNDDIKYLTEQLESVVKLLHTNKHLAAARLLSIISATKVFVNENTLKQRG